MAIIEAAKRQPTNAILLKGANDTILVQEATFATSGPMKPTAEALEQQSPDHVEMRSWGRQVARWSVLAAFLSCTLNCVFNQLAARAAASFGQFDRVVGWTSLLMVIAGATLGVAGLVSGWRRRSVDTMVIAGIGLVLNGGILFVVVWYFTMIRR